MNFKKLTMKKATHIFYALASIVFMACTQAVTSTIPTVTTSPISGITFTSAMSGGTVTGDGGDPVAMRGICWSTTAHPTTADNVINATANTFTADITGLSQHGGTYYVRAFATNSMGTAYGNEEVFDSWKLDGSKWGFLLNYSTSNSNYPGDVDFFADGTTKWDEPAYPGAYTTLGTWTVSKDKVSYNMTGDPAATSYIYTGVVINNSTMSGTFTWSGSADKTFTATKYP